MPRDPCIPRDWEPGERATLVYLLHGDSVLLIRKLRGHGAGKINAPGGRVEAGESVEAAAIREVAEEVGVRVQALELRALLRYDDPAEGLAMEGFAFVSSEFPRHSNALTAEADPFWCRIDESSLRAKCGRTTVPGSRGYFGASAFAPISATAGAAWWRIRSFPIRTSPYRAPVYSNRPIAPFKDHMTRNAERNQP